MAQAATKRSLPGSDAPDTALALRLAERIGRIAWLTAHCHHVAPASILRKPRFDPEATLARMVAIAVSRETLQAPLDALAAIFGETEEIMAASCNRIGERCERDPAFAASINFLKASCASILGTGTAS